MFDRYTGSAQRVLFFARYEASVHGGLALDTDHILLGLVRERAGSTWRALERADVPHDALREEIRAASPVRERVATSVEMPFTAAAARVLRFTAEEADRLQHVPIGPEHLLLGLLREEESAAATILLRHGLSLDSVRQDVAAYYVQEGAVGEEPTAVDLGERLDRIKDLVGDLGAVSAGESLDVQHVAATMVQAIQAELALLKRLFGQ